LFKIQEFGFALLSRNEMSTIILIEERIQELMSRSQVFLYF